MAGIGGKTKTSGQGRPKGTPNKVTAELKDMIRTALDESGGVEYLKEQASSNPNAFLSLVGKIIPKDIKHEVSGGKEPIKVDLSALSTTALQELMKLHANSTAVHPE
jgi:hypothetical protein